MTHPLFGFLFLFLLLLFDAEEIAEAVEVFLHDEAETLRVQTVARKIAVVGLIVHAYGEVAVREDEVAEVEIADETLRGIRIVAITELAIEEQAVVEQLAAQNALIFGIVETFIARRYVGTEIPVVALYHVGKYGVQLLRDGAAQQALHRQRSLTLLFAILAHLVVVGLGVEPADAQEIEHLLVHLFLRIDDRVDHLLRIAVNRRQVHREIYLRRLRRAGDVHQAVYADVVARERTAYAQVAQRHSVYGIFSPQIEWGVVWVATEGDGAARHKLELFLDEILNGELVGAMINHIVAEHIERALVEVVGADYAISVEGDIIARLLVHDQLEREVLVGVYEEIDSHIRFEIDVIIPLLRG